MPEVASLQRGVYEALAGSVDLTTLLGGVRVYDDAPQAAPYPFITLGQSVVRDGTRHRGRRRARSHAACLVALRRQEAGASDHRGDQGRAARSGRSTLADHHLVNLRHELSEARFDPDGDTFHGIVRYRAVAEPSRPSRLSD